MPTSSIPSTRTAAIAGIAGAVITAVGGAVVQLVVQPSTDVSDDMWSYPWSSGALVPISLLWSVAHVLVVVGLIGFSRSGQAGETRAARVGIGLAVAGTALLVVGELASIPIRDARMDDTSAGMVGAVFGLATVLSAIGFLLAGVATLSAKLWRGWRRFTPIVAGIWTTALVGLAFATALPGGIAIYGLCLLAINVALYTQPSPATTVAAERVHQA